MSNSLGKTTYKGKLIPDILYDFSRALYGNFCRTVCCATFFENGYVTSRWLEAHQDRQGSWSLYLRSSAQDISSDSDKMFDQQKLESDLSLMQVMSKMAKFEREQQDEEINTNASIHFPEQEAENLGAQHYKIFGIREGIAFDAITKLPAPSFEGRIVGEGTFSQDMEQAVAAAWSNKVNTFGEDDVFLSSLVLNSKPSQALNSLFADMNRTKSLEELVDYFETQIFALFDLCKERGFDHPVPAEGGKEQLAGEALEAIILTTLTDENITKEFESSLGKEDIQRVQNALISLDVFRCILQARWAIESAKEGKFDTAETEGFVEWQIGVIAEKYSDYNFTPPDQETITASILDYDSNNAMDIEGGMKTIREDLQKMLEGAKTELNKGSRPTIKAATSQPARRPS